jgi:hypothetical protein
VGKIYSSAGEVASRTLDVQRQQTGHTEEQRRQLTTRILNYGGTSEQDNPGFERKVAHCTSALASPLYRQLCHTLEHLHLL